MNKSNLVAQLKSQHNKEGYSYVATLAANAQVEGVNDFIKASPSSASEAIYGYASGGNINKMRMLIEAHSNHEQALKMAVQGLVRGGYFNELYQIKGYASYKGNIILGYAQAGNVNKVSSLVNRNPQYFKKAVEGYASANHGNPLFELIEGTIFYGDAIYYAAYAGNITLVNKLLAHRGVEENTAIIQPKTQSEISQFASLNRALSGYCRGFHLEQASLILARGGDVQTALDELKIKNTPNVNVYKALLMLMTGTKAKLLQEAITTEILLMGDISPISEALLMDEERAKLIKFLSEKSDKLFSIEAEHMSKTGS